MAETRQATPSMDTEATEKCAALAARLVSTRRGVERLLRFARAGFQKRPDPLPRWRFVEDSRGSRLIIGLETRGCSYARGAFGGCSVCGHVASTLWRRDITDDELIASLSDTLLDVGDRRFTTVCLFTSGSFLDDTEISPSARHTILEMVRAIWRPSKIIIESLPSFIVPGQVNALAAAGHTPQVMVSIGMDGGTDLTRSICAAKEFTNRQYETAIKNCLSLGVSPAVYVGLGLPFLTPGEAIHDAVEGLHLATAYGAEEVSLEPVALQEATLQKLLFVTQYYTRPTVWWVGETLREWVKRYPSDQGQVRFCIGGSIYTPIPFSAFSACANCIEAVAKTIRPSPLAETVRQLHPTCMQGSDCCLDRRDYCIEPASLNHLEVRIETISQAVIPDGGLWLPLALTNTS